MTVELASGRNPLSTGAQEGSLLIRHRHLGKARLECA